MKTTFVVLMVSAATVTAAVEFGSDIHVKVGHNRAAREAANTGLALEKKGDTAGALKKYTEALELEPTLWPVRHNRACVFVRQKKWQLAIQDLNMALRSKPDFLPSTILRSSIYIHLGNYRAALAELNKVIGAKPDANVTASALNERAWMEATCPDASFRDGKRAVADAKRACELSHWKGIATIDTLAAACAEAGDFEGAVRYQEQALAGFRDNPKSREVKAALQEHLELYKKHQPLRDTAK